MDGFYKRYDLDDNRQLQVQWHLTAECPYNCSHCYIPNSPEYKSEIENQLNTRLCFELIDQLKVLIQKAEIKTAFVSLTGGDPLVRNDFFSILKYLKEKLETARVSIMSTPRLISEDKLKKIKSYGINAIQLSVDGIGENHDIIRGKGAFSELEKSIELIKLQGLGVSLMFTLGTENRDQLIPVMEWASKKGVKTMAFARLVPMGNALKNTKEAFFEPVEYQFFLIEVLKTIKRLKDEGSETVFSFKEPLWELLFSDYGQVLGRAPGNCCFLGGILVILADGTLYPCRRLPLKIGKFPQDYDISEVFINSPLMNSLRDFSRYEKCGSCKLQKCCGGAPCISYAQTGSPFSPDPQCWL